MGGMTSETWREDQDNDNQPWATSSNADRRESASIAIQVDVLEEFKKPRGQGQQGRAY